ncbi:MAG: DUF6259 domain-containing protein [Verrucomicrobiota bacterium]
MKHFLLALPWLAGFALLAAEPGNLVLRTDRLTLELGQKQNGAIVSLVDQKTGTEFVANQLTPRLFTLCFTKKSAPGSEKIYLSSSSAKKYVATRKDSSAGQQVTLNYEGLGDWPVQVQCVVRAVPADPLLRWRISVKIPEDLVLEQVHYPLVVLKAPLGESVDDDAAVCGAAKGGVVRQPGNFKVGTRISEHQPGSLAAQFGCYYDSRSGVYLAAHDDQGYPKDIILQRTKEGLEFNWMQASYSGKTYTLDYDVVLTTFSTADKTTATDWRDAADIYKNWALTRPWCATLFAQRTDIPAWMKEGPAMVRFSRQWLAQPELIERWVSQYWRKQFPDAPLIMAYWGWEKVENWITPDYFPLYPSDKQFTNLVARLRPFNTHAFPWPSGYHWTLTFDKKADGAFQWDDRKRFDQVARSHAIHNRSGELYLRTPSWLKGGNTACLCPGDPWTIQWWNQDICVPLALRGVEMIQVDQVVGGGFPACYEKSHPHPPGHGKWMTEVFTKQLLTMYAACRAIQPDAVVCFEEPNERFNHLVGIQDYRDCEASREWASVFGYLYHEFLPVFQSNPRGQDLVMAAYCLANGEMPHMVPSMNFGDKPLLRNGGFEDISGWDHIREYQGQKWNGKWYRDEADVHGGKASLRLENLKATDTVQISQNVDVNTKTFSAGRKYRLSAWMKTAAAEKQNGINFGFFLANGKFASAGRLVMPPAGAGWKKVEAEFLVPDGATMMRIMIQAGNVAKVWVADMVLAEVLPDGSAKPVQQSSDQPLQEFMKQWVTLYHGAGRPYLEFGRMLHPPTLKCARITRGSFTLSAIQHNAYRAADGTEAVVLANATWEKQTATLLWQGRSQSIELLPAEVRLIK